MDSLAMEDPQPSSSAQPKEPYGQPASQSQLSPVVNGGGCYLSPPTSPGAMSVGSSYDNTSPPFSPLSSPSPASSGSFNSPLHGGGGGGSQDQGSSLPPVPLRSSSYNFTSQPPVPQPFTALSVFSCSTTGVQKLLESPRFQRKALLETPPSPKPARRNVNQDSSATAGGRDPEIQRHVHMFPTVSISPPSDPQSIRQIGSPSSHRSSPKLSTGSLSSSPSSPRIKRAQERPACLFREQPQVDHSPTSMSSLPLPSSRSFQPPLDPIIHIIQGGSAQIQQQQGHSATLQPPKSPRLARRNLEMDCGSISSLNSMRDLPPLSPSLSRRGVPSLSTLRTPEGPLGKLVPESPRLGRKAAAFSPEEQFSPRLVRARSPSPTSGLIGGEGSRGRKASFPNPLSPAFSLGSLPGSSPLASPRSQRKMSGELHDPRLMHPGMRQRKNSITEISDNEDELLEYHRRQHTERLREQEMERLVSSATSMCPLTLNLTTMLTKPFYSRITYISSH